MSTSFFSEMLNSITERGRALLDRTRDHRGNAAARSDSLAEYLGEQPFAEARAQTLSRVRRDDPLALVDDLPA